MVKRQSFCDSLDADARKLARVQGGVQQYVPDVRAAMLTQQVRQRIAKNGAVCAQRSEHIGGAGGVLPKAIATEKKA